jgi:hypothetical protein
VKTFVAGGPGAIGRQLVPMLVRQGFSELYAPAGGA